MARRKRNSPVLEKAHMRAVSLTTIDPQLTLNSELTLTAYKEQISTVQTMLNAYNVRLGDLDGMLNDIEAEEEKLKVMTARMLAAVGAIYGKNSNEYEQAGGKRSSEISRK
jgi:hypothetical protein